MNNKFLPSLVTGFAAGVLLSVPGVKGLFLYITLPVAVYFALFLNIKLNDGLIPVKIRTAVLFGILTGLWAAFFSTVFDTLLTYIMHNNDFTDAFPEIKKQFKEFNLGDVTKEFLGMFGRMDNDIRNNGFSPVYTFLMLTGNIIIYVIFGIIGGFISRIFLNKPKPQQ